MDVREKLVELIGSTEYGNGSLVGKNFQKGFIEKIASNLIANGATVQEWISVKDRLPEHRDVVLCFMKFGEHRILQWDNVSSWWLGYGQGDDWQKSDVTHWSKMPQPPKGE